MKKSKRILTLSLVAMLILLAASIALAAVEVEYFEVQSWIGNVVTVEWETATQNDIEAFYIWRSEENLPVTNGEIDTTQATLLNAVPITNDINGNSHACGPDGGMYEWADDTISSELDTYWYYLEAKKCLSDTREFYDEVLSYEENQPGGLEANRPNDATPSPTPTTVTGTVTATATGTVTATATAATATATAATATATATATSTTPMSTPTVTATATPSGSVLYLPIIAKE